MDGKPLGSTFRIWLLLGVLTAFVVFQLLGWSFITGMANDDAKNTLDMQLEHLESSILDDAAFAAKLEEGGLSFQEAAEVMQERADATVTNYQLWIGGIGVLAEQGVVVASNRPELVGIPFEDLLAEPAKRTPIGKLLGDDSFEAYVMPGIDEPIFAKSKTMELGVGNESADYSVLVGLPESEVYLYRAPFMVWLAVASGALLVIAYVLVMALLRRKVVRNIEATNEVLERITKGDLDQEVRLPDVREFADLAAGINATVGTLKGSIAEAQGRIDRELSTAKAIQESALPSTFPPFPEIDAFDIYADMKPAKEVGGDFYDFFLLDDGTLGLVMADVSGKGIPAALFMMGAKTEIQACIMSGMGLAESLQTANYQLCQGNDANMFVTVFAAIIDYNNGRMEYVNAGHNPPLLRHDGSWKWLRDKSGLFLGAYQKLRLKTYETDLEKGDVLLLYTDGVTEAWNPDEELYGEERLEVFLQGLADLAPRSLVGVLRGELDKWADGADQADDITLLALEYGAKPLSTDTLEVPSDVDEIDRVATFVNAELARRLCPSSALNKIDICLEELFVSVASFAYGAGDGIVRVTYTYLPDPQGIRVEISDEGAPFDPLAEPDSDDLGSEDDEGLGIFMTKQIADSLVYEHRDNRNVTTFEYHWG